MSFDEAKRLLARIVAYDNRSVDAATIESWRDILRGYSYDECMWAFREFARVNTSEFLRPGHLTVRINERRSEYRMMNPDRPGEPDAWLEFEHMQELLAVEARAARASGARYAVEAAMDPGLDDDA
jgi:hypothetical protein